MNDSSNRKLERAGRQRFLQRSRGGFLRTSLRPNVRDAIDRIVTSKD